jgi:hypothetical protein
VSHASTDTPEIWFKSQRVIRTILAALVVFVPVANASLPLLAESFNSSDVPAEVYLWVNGVIAAALAVLGVLTRVMAIPAVNAFLTKFGAGSVPKSTVES